MLDSSPESTVHLVPPPSWRSGELVDGNMSRTGHIGTPVGTHLDVSLGDISILGLLPVFFIRYGTAIRVKVHVMNSFV